MYDEELGDDARNRIKGLARKVLGGVYLSIPEFIFSFSQLTPKT